MELGNFDGYLEWLPNGTFTTNALKGAAGADTIKEKGSE